ncbi:DNA-processing protein DprA [Corynebacterium macclintockiae]|uniref:DNA-processing protein DprA n=1 Tax=Corynebacterium macclintockiae TaxID=2913501 RepID=UPI003EB8D4A8
MTTQKSFLAWAYVRRVVEASRVDVLDMLWPDGWDQAGSSQVRAVADALSRRAGTLPDALADATSQRYDHDPTADAELAAARGWRLVTPEDDEWPTELTASFVRMADSGADHDSSVRGQAAAPFALWVRGDMRLDTAVRRSVTVVGTRAATRYGEQVTKSFAGDLADAGFSLISGGAIGIDALVHRAALQSQIPTLVVMACGLDVPYPKAHAELFEQIVAAGGLLISEYPPGTPPARHRFLTRNRLAAALSQATLVVEAPLRSGALNTLNWAEAFVKPTFAVPGPVTSHASLGCLERIRTSRATLAVSARDLIEELSPLGEQMAWGFGAEDRSELLNWEHVAVIDAAALPSGRGPEGRLPQLVEATGLPARTVIRCLRDLEGMGRLRREADRWIRVE